MFARAVPKFDMIMSILGKEFFKFLGYHSRMNLIWVNWGVEDPLCSIKGVSDDHYMIGVEVGDSLIYAVLDSK